MKATIGGGQSEYLPSGLEGCSAIEAREAENTDSLVVALVDSLVIE